MFAATTLGCLAAAFAGCSVTNSSPASGSVVPSATQRAHSQSGSQKYDFTTLDDPQTSTYTKVLGMNNEGKLVGYYGSNPSIGFYATPPYGPNNFHEVVYPSSADTIVSAVNDKAYVAGYYVGQKGATLGFTFWQGLYFNFADRFAEGSPPVTELIGLNDSDDAVGFYVNANGVDVPVQMSLATGLFQKIKTPAGESAVATAMSGHGHIVGYAKTSSGNDVAWILIGTVRSEFSYPGAAATRAYGITTYDHIVGSYTDASGNTHGFFVTNALNKRATWQAIDDPLAAGTTVITNINIHGDIVGYYVDSAGNTHGFFATPST
ncbi:MAG TPA: hypothetical protein VGX91_03940 [Candidatus Cybelea sp.]|jgi:hypothetical protein|nr:hypothetical protein [Candidatus Cybelea sp.]